MMIKPCYGEPEADELDGQQSLYTSFCVVISTLHHSVVHPALVMYLNLAVALLNFEVAIGTENTEFKTPCAKKSILLINLYRPPPTG